MANIVLSVLGSDKSAGATRSAEGNLDRLKAARERAAAALVAATNREADASGRAKIAAAQLAEAQSKYAADSSQVIRAAERVAAAQRGQQSAASNLQNATERLAGAQTRMRLHTEETAAAASRGTSTFSTFTSGLSSFASTLGSGVVAGGAAGAALGALNIAAGIASAGFQVLEEAASRAFEIAKEATIDYNSQLENATIGFTTMLGSGKKATDFLNSLQDFAAKTPFQFSDLTNYAQQMIGYGVSAKNVIPYLTALGDAAAGSGKSSADLGNAVLAFEQMAAKGKVDLGNLNQLTNAGIPATAILAQKYHVSQGALMDMISAGKVASGDALPKLISGIEHGTDSTAKFGGMMGKQSKTFAGSMSNIQDSVMQTLSKAFLPIFKVLEGIAGQLAKFAGSKEVQTWAKDTAKWLGDLFSPKNMAAIGDFFGAIFGNKDMKSGGSKIFADLGKAVQGIGPAFKKIVPDVEEFGKKVLPGLLGFVDMLIKHLPQFIQFVSDLSGSMRTAAPYVANIVKFLTGFVSAILDVISALTHFEAGVMPTFIDLRDKVGKFFADAGKWLLEAGKNVIGGLVRGIQDAVGGVTKAVSDVADGVVGTFKSALGIKSPSRVFMQLGRWMTEGLAQGVQAGTADEVASSMQDLVDKVTDGYSRMSDEVRTAREKVAAAEEAQRQNVAAHKQMARERDAAEEALHAAKTEKQRDAARSRLAAIDDRWDASNRASRKIAAELAAAQETIAADKSYKTRQGQQKRLLGLIAETNTRLTGYATQRDAINARLDDATKARDQAVDTRAGYADSIIGNTLGLGNVAAAYGTARDARDAAAQNVSDMQAQLADLDQTAAGYEADRADLLEQIAAAQSEDGSSVDTLNRQLADLDKNVAKYQTDRAALTGKIQTAGNAAGANPVAALIENLRKQVSDAKEFKADVLQLKQRGLDDASFKQLVDAYGSGSGLDTARALVGVDNGSIAAITELQTQLKAAAQDLGYSSAGTLYDSGVQAAQGLVDGLQSQRDALTKMMTELANTMVSTLRTQLGIKSPSRVFKTQGLFVTDGLVEGITAGQPRVDGAIRALVDPTGVGSVNRSVGGGTAAAGFGMTGSGPLVHIDEFHATPEQSPADIAAALGWMARGGL